MIPSFYVTVHGDCPNFRGALELADEMAVFAAKMGLSPSRYERGQVHVFGQR